jgi:hypothetical protein
VISDLVYGNNNSNNVDDEISIFGESSVSHGSECEDDCIQGVCSV